MFDGGGGSNNPRPSLLNLRPRLARGFVSIGQVPTPVSIALHYLIGLRSGRLGRSGQRACSSQTDKRRADPPEQLSPPADAAWKSRYWLDTSEMCRRARRFSLLP